MFAVLRGTNGRRHEVVFGDDPFSVDVAMSASTIQITMTAAEPGEANTARYVTVALPREALISAMAVGTRTVGVRQFGIKLVGKD